MCHMSIQLPLRSARRCHPNSTTSHFSVKDVLEDGMEIHVVPSMTIPTYERAGLNTVDQIDCEGDAAIGVAEGV
jgi:hypothetical protein